MNKILFVASEPSPGMIPFAATIINTLSKDDRFDVRCICVNNNAFNNNIEDSVNSIFVDTPSHKIHKLIGKFYPYQLINIIKKIDKEFKPDYIHFLTGDYTLAFFIRKNADKRYCYTVHDLHAHPLGKASFKQKFMSLIINRGYASNTKICKNLTSSSHSQVMELKDMYPKRNIMFTSFPTLVTNDIMLGVKTVPELHDINNYILFFGGVKEYKGIDDLVHAFKHLRKSKDLKLVIAGKGKSYNNTDNSIIHVNRIIDDTEIRDLFTNAQVVVYPYTSATMSGVLSIAYYFSKKVLVSDLPFFKENKSACCTFFKAGDRNDLKDKLQAIINGTHFIASKCYQETYSAEKLANDYAEFYYSISH